MKVKVKKLSKRNRVAMDNTDLFIDWVELNRPMFEYFTTNGMSMKVNCLDPLARSVELNIDNPGVKGATVFL